MKVNCRVEQTWKSFFENIEKKKLFLFGIGKLGSEFIAQYHDKVYLEGIIDNDAKKQGVVVSEIVAEAMDTRWEYIVISDISILKQYMTEQVVVLIANKKYEPIVIQLQEMGIDNYFSYYILEDKNCVFIIDDSRKEYLEKCLCHKIDNQKIIVSIGNYGGHGKYITQKLLELKPNLDIVWIVNDLAMVHPEKVRVIYEGNWKKYMYEMETAHIWIFDILIPEYVRKRKGQIYIQTKHWSSITLKKFYLDDVSTTASESARQRVTYNGQIMDYIFTGSEFDEQSCRSGFAFRGECIQIGSARTDAVFCEVNRDKIYTKYHIDKDVHSVLYAPTFRFNKDEKKKHLDVLLDCRSVKDALEKKFGGNWVILLRIHPSLKVEKTRVEQEGFVINVSDYCDSQELVAASDIMISDYSSIMFETVFVNRPVFLFAPDREQYVNSERELLIEYDSLPFSVAETNDELTQNIECFEQSEYEARVTGFMKKYGVHEDGHASERAAQFIVNLLDECEEGEMI